MHSQLRQEEISAILKIQKFQTKLVYIRLFFSPKYHLELIPHDKTKASLQIKILSTTLHTRLASMNPEIQKAIQMLRSQSPPIAEN